MFCSRCGSEVTGKSRFCPSCGLDLLSTTPVAAIASGQITDFDLVREALASKYEILEELGRGGMALVYRAKDRQLEREVAVKVLPFSLAFDAEFVERFQREARTSAQLEHPNIIPIYRVGRAGRVIYFVMKYLRGGALSNILGARRALTPPEIRRLLLEAGSALGYAAQRGIVHRDIKPDNIMFDEFGHCVLTDFGIAKAASGQKLTGTGMSIGTPHYMSPEQARAQSIDGRSDIYSLGIVAYQCLAGTVPYDGEDSFSIGYKHITEPIPTPTLITADERRIFEVIKRMLMKDPADRFQSCEELVASIHRWTAEFQAGRLPLDGFRQRLADAAVDLRDLLAGIARDLSRNEPQTLIESVQRHRRNSAAHLAEVGLLLRTGLHLLAHAPDRAAPEVADGLALLRFGEAARLVFSEQLRREAGFPLSSLAVGGVLFALVPYHFYRAEGHLMLSAYYAVPLGAYLAVRCARGEPLWVGRRRWGTAALCAVIACAYALIGAVSVIRDFAMQIEDMSGAVDGATVILFKVLGITMITRIGAQLCKDAGEGSLSLKLEMLGSALALITSLPLLSGILNIASSFIKG
jgi:stage III sporulation protein AD